VPDAAPVVECRATDDYGLAKLVARAVVVRESPDGKDRHRREPVTLFDGQKPLTSGQLPLDAKYPLPLSQFKLTKGDQLELVLEVVDYRGDSAGKAATTEPIVLSVTDPRRSPSSTPSWKPSSTRSFSGNSTSEPQNDTSRTTSEIGSRKYEIGNKRRPQSDKF
jgi:hypothetical protein